MHSVRDFICLPFFISFIDCCLILDDKLFHVVIVCVIRYYCFVTTSV